MKKIIVIVGPTASGKTKLSIEIAKKYNGECINFDSTQIFKGTDIATNKVTKEEMCGVVHHMLSIKEVNESIDVVEFRNNTRKIIDQLLDKKTIPVLVGGTGFYLLGIIKNYSFFGKKRENAYFQDSDLILDNDIDFPLIKGSDKKRQLRKLQLKDEVELSTIDLENEERFFYDNLIIIGLDPDREALYKRINDRVLELTNIGLFKEIESAYIDNDKDANAQALKCIGGREVVSFINKEITYDECIQLMQKNNRNYAKRQMTYFKNKFNNKVTWFKHNFKNYEECCQEIFEYLDKQLKSPH